MRQAEKTTKKFQSRIPLKLDPGKKIPKKIAKKFKKLKTSFWYNFQPKRVEIGREREKKILVPNSVHTRPGQENSQRNSKKIQKIKKLNSSFISIQKGLREAEKERKKFWSRIPFILNLGKKISKKIAKKFKKLNNPFLALFLAKTG